LKNVSNLALLFNDCEKLNDEAVKNSCATILGLSALKVLDLQFNKCPEMTD